MATEIWVNIGSGNDLLPDGTKPLPEPMLTWLIISKLEWHSSRGKFTRDTPAINHWNYLENKVPKISFKFPRGKWVNPSRLRDTDHWTGSQCQNYEKEYLQVRHTSWALRSFQMCYRYFIQNEITLTTHCLTRRISKLPNTLSDPMSIYC